MKSEGNEWLREVLGSMPESDQDEETLKNDFDSINEAFKKRDAKRVNQTSVKTVKPVKTKKGAFQQAKEDFLNTRSEYKKQLYDERKQDLLKIKEAVKREISNLQLYFDITNVDYVTNKLINEIINLYDKDLITSIKSNGFNLKKNKLGKSVFVTYNSFIFTKLVHYMGKTDSIKYTNSYVNTYQTIRSRILNSYKKRRECYYALLGTEQYVNSLTNEYAFSCLKDGFSVNGITEKVIDERLESDRRKVLEIQSHKKNYAESLEMGLLVSTIITGFPPLLVAYTACSAYNDKNRDDLIENEKYMLSHISPMNYNATGAPVRK